MPSTDPTAPAPRRLAWRAALRLGPWRLAPVLRVDQVWTVSGDVAARTSVGGGVEWSF